MFCLMEFHKFELFLIYLFLFDAILNFIYLYYIYLTRCSCWLFYKWTFYINKYVIC